jgi:hypothetical protein
MLETAFSWAGLPLIAGGALLGATIVMLALGPAMDGALRPRVAVLMLLASILLLISLPGMYAAQAAAAGWVGAVGYVLLQAGVVFLVALAVTPLLYPALRQAPGESVVAFLLGIVLVLGLLLTGIATMSAGVFPRATGILLLAATAGFFFTFFVAEFLPRIAMQLGSAFFGIVLGTTLAWIGFFLVIS